MTAGVINGEENRMKKPLWAGNIEGEEADGDQFGRGSPKHYQEDS